MIGQIFLHHFQPFVTEKRQRVSVFPDMLPSLLLVLTSILEKGSWSVLGRGKKRIRQKSGS